MTPTLKLVVFKFANVKRVLLGEFKFTDATAHSILPLALVEVAVRPAIYSNPVWLVLVVVAEVDTLVGVDVAA